MNRPSAAPTIGIVPAADAPVLCVASPDGEVCRRAVEALGGEAGEVRIATTLDELIASAEAGARLAVVDPSLDGLDPERPLTRLRAIAALHPVRILLMSGTDIGALRRARLDSDLFALIRRVQLQVAGDQQVEMLRDATRRLTAIPEMHATTRALLDLLAEHVDLDTATLFLHDGGGRLEARAALGYELDLQRLRTFPIGEGIAGWVAAQRQGTIVGDSDLDTRFATADARGSRSLLAVPLLVGNSLMGVVTLVRRAPKEPFVDADMLLVGTLATAAATALENARLAEHERVLSDRLREVEATLGREREILSKLDAYDRTYTQVVSTVSHELKTPLMGIRGFALLLSEGAADPEEAKDFAREIHDNAVRLCGYVEEMLEEDQVNAGRVRLRLEPVDIGALTDKVLHSLGAGVSARHRLVSAIPRNLPRVAGDPERLRQVLVNLVGNAVKYSPDGGTVRVLARRSHGQVIVTVEDQGLGIPVAERDRVFDRFYRVDGEANRGIKGTGLGLGLVRQLVDLHGGRVWIDDGPGGRGTSMRVALPEALPVEAGKVPAAAADPRPAAGLRSEPAPGSIRLGRPPAARRSRLAGEPVPPPAASSEVA